MKDNIIFGTLELYGSGINEWNIFENIDDIQEKSLRIGVYNPIVDLKGTLAIKIK